ncbi:uncharacterized protein BDV14DRAFT_185516 [Aspergillus stella-maris]|uniref:uncharacterized protein n=1 Tax=Aspergillus stella-maris TaxID=1810926 RepID=UPI003CCD1FD0
MLRYLVHSLPCCAPTRRPKSLPLDNHLMSQNNPIPRKPVKPSERIFKMLRCPKADAAAS